MHSENEVVYLYLDDIIPNRFQPREVFDDRALQELAMSIKEHGVIQPIIVRNIGDKYEIIAGERRYKASALAGLTKIPAIVRNLDDKESSKVALLENLQRRDLNAIEEARTYQKILELDQMTQEELAKTMGKSQPAIANKLRLLTLPDEVQEALLKEKISERHARSLLSLDSQEQQINLMNQVINQRMTVRELDNEIKKIKNPIESTTTENSFNPLQNPEKPRFILDPILENVSNNETEVDDSETGNQNEMNGFIEPTSSEKPMADLDYLLNLKKPVPTETSISLEEQLEERLNKVSIIESDDDQPVIQTIKIEKQAEDPIETLSLDEPVEENDTPQAFSGHNLKNAIQDTRSFIQNLEQQGFSVNSEEMDFENIYQITIKIDKNK